MSQLVRKHAAQAPSWHASSDEGRSDACLCARRLLGVMMAQGKLQTAVPSNIGGIPKEQETTCVRFRPCSTITCLVGELSRKAKINQFFAHAFNKIYNERPPVSWSGVFLCSACGSNPECTKLPFPTPFQCSPNPPNAPLHIHGDVTPTVQNNVHSHPPLSPTLTNFQTNASSTPGNK